MQTENGQHIVDEEKSEIKIYLTSFSYSILLFKTLQHTDLSIFFLRHTEYTKKLSKIYDKNF